MTWLWRTAVLRGWGRVEFGCWVWFRVGRYLREQGGVVRSALRVIGNGVNV